MYNLPFPGEAGVPYLCRWKSWDSRSTRKYSAQVSSQTSHVWHDQPLYMLINPSVPRLTCAVPPGYCSLPLGFHGNVRAWTPRWASAGFRQCQGSPAAGITQHELWISQSCLGWVTFQLLGSTAWMQRLDFELWLTPGTVWVHHHVVS